MLFIAAYIASLLYLAVATPTKNVRPLVIWHGLGDTYDSAGMTRVQEEVKKMHPGIFVHLIRMNEDSKEDQRAGFYGNVNEQVAFAASQLANISELSQGFDAVGFSQGGQFLRAYIERYNEPPVNNLVTFGSQHMGISDLPVCSAYDLLCQIARRATKGGVYNEWVQENLVQAQYFRDPNQLPLYVTSSKFLADINNEVLLPSERNGTYADNFSTLSNLVLVKFEKDRTVVPKESSWFGSQAPSDTSLYQSTEQVPLGGPRPLRANDDREIIRMEDQPLYQEDWIGLRALDERGVVTFSTCEGEHMDLTGCWEDIVAEYVGGLL